MKRFIIAAAVAVALGLSSAARADAQYVIPYYGYTPNGGIVSGNSIYGPGGYQTNRSYFSPYGTIRQQSYYTDVFGNSAGVSRGYSPYGGYSYNQGFYNPNPYMNPYGGFSYGRGFNYGTGLGYNYYFRR